MGKECKAAFLKLIEEGRTLVTKTEETNLRNIEGMKKLRRRILNEVSFLEKAVEGEVYRSEYTKCTSLSHYKLLVDHVISDKTCISVLKSFRFEVPEEKRKIYVDFVCQEGTCWCKVINRNAPALTKLAKDSEADRNRSIINQGRSYADAAHQHRVLLPPKIIFYFNKGVELSIASTLQDMGIIVRGTIIDQALYPSNRISHISQINNILSVKPNYDEIKILNLDVTAMVAYASFIRKEEEISDDMRLIEQDEILDLDEIFRGKELICCRSALLEFQSVVNKVGGTEEKKRTMKLLERIRIVEDNWSTRTKNLSESKHITDLCKIVFGTGDKHRALTVTANKKFLLAAEQKGERFAVVLHKPRTLKEIRDSQKKTASCEVDVKDGRAGFEGCLNEDQ